MTRRPSMQDLSGPLAAAARSIAAEIARAGKRAYLVGGAPRDLALGRDPREIDMASAARPEEVEALFQATIPVGRAFGTLIVRAEGLDVQLTTFRSESGYSDARRPDAVVYGSTVLGDSSRRDFTCNALYLDPLDDEFQDPQGGLADLAAGRLRCVGDALERFREDGLRLLRLARFAAALGLDPDPAALEAASASKESLRGVSPERVRDELESIFEGPDAARAIRLLDGLDLLPLVIPGFGGVGLERVRILKHLPSPPGLALGLAALLDSGREVARLRPSRALAAEIEAIWKVAGTAEQALGGTRSERVRWMRSPSFEAGLALSRARLRARGMPIDAVDAAVAERKLMGDGGLRPIALVTAEDLVRFGIRPGPLFGEILHEAESLQLDEKLATREQALAWLSARAKAAAQEGGKTPRSAKEIG